MSKLFKIGQKYFTAQGSRDYTGTCEVLSAEEFITRHYMIGLALIY